MNAPIAAHEIEALPSVVRAALDALANPDVAAAALAALAERTHDERYSRASGQLRGAKAGRKAVDDSAALAQMDNLIRWKIAATVEQAARYVARTLRHEHSTAAAAHRLARKYRRRDAGYSRAYVLAGAPDDRDKFISVHTTAAADVAHAGTNGL